MCLTTLLLSPGTSELLSQHINSLKDDHSTQSFSSMKFLFILYSLILFLKYMISNITLVLCSSKKKREGGKEDKEKKKLSQEPEKLPRSQKEKESYQSGTSIWRTHSFIWGLKKTECPLAPLLKFIFKFLLRLQSQIA